MMKPFANHRLPWCGWMFAPVLIPLFVGQTSKRFEKLGMKPNDSPATFPLITEFDAVVTYYQMPFAKHRSIACDKRPRMTRGTCTSEAKKKNRSSDCIVVRLASARR
jgi:hypothetical protein